MFELLFFHLIKIFFPHIFSDTVDDLAAKEIGSEQISQGNRNMATTVKKHYFFSHVARKNGFQRTKDFSQTATNFFKGFLGYLIDLAGKETHVLFSSNSPPFGQNTHLKFDIFQLFTFF